MMQTATGNKTINETNFFAGILAAISNGENEPEILFETHSESLTQSLNRMIEAGASFDVAADDFQVVGSENLTTTDKYFLEQNKTGALCHLQQFLLVKHLFSHSPEQFEEFAFEIYEREAIITDGGEASFPVHCAAVKSVTAKWFARLLDTMPNRKTNK